jgi:hypothetical protein
VASLPSITPPCALKACSTTQSALRHDIDAQLRMAGRRDAGRVVDVLQGVGDALHRALVDALGEIRIGGLGVAERAFAPVTRMKLSIALSSAAMRSSECLVSSIEVIVPSRSIVPASVIE